MIHCLVRGRRQQFRETLRRDQESERVRFEARRKRTREATTKEIETMREAEAERGAITLAEHARELREVGGWGREEKEENNSTDVGLG